MTTPLQKHTLPLVGIIEEAPRVRTFLFPRPDGLTWDPGSHMHVGLPGFDADGERHPALVRHMSVCTLPEEGRLGFTTRLDSSASVFKESLARLKPGDELTFFKFGSSLAPRRDGRPLVIVSQGVGVASARPLALAYDRDQTGIPSLTLIIVGSRRHGVYRDLLDFLAAPGFAVERVDHRDELQGALASVPDPEGATFDVVGSDAFLRSCIASLRGLGVADDQIVLDKSPVKRASFFE